VQPPRGPQSLLNRGTVSWCTNTCRNSGRPCHAPLCVDQHRVLVEAVGRLRHDHACVQGIHRQVRTMRVALSLLCLLAAAVPASCAGPALPSGYRLPDPSGRESPQTVCLLHHPTASSRNVSMQL
jgi:hypothetical protein